jgi:hypothetical protein
MGEDRRAVIEAALHEYVNADIRRGMPVAEVSEIVEGALAAWERSRAPTDAVIEDTPSGFPIAGPVVIRTVTHYYTGKVVEVQHGFVILDDAAWIADTGRWSEFLANGTPSEVEPFPDLVAVSLGAIVDVTRWAHPLPREMK